MDDLLPFLIVILISIIGSIGRIKKKRTLQQNSVQPQQKQKNEDLFSWLEKLNDNGFNQPVPYQSDSDMMQEEKSFETIQEEVAPVVEKTENKYAKYTGFISPEEKQKLVENEGKSAVKKENTEGDLTTTKRKTLMSRDKQKSRFDLRQAVIYSEVLKRKY